jgi:phosphoribosyl 1,2-cyclic phosphodiesterase
MQVQFYGVRGSIASAQPNTSQVGGNTSCVAIQSGDDLIICDAGTGIAQLGQELLGQSVKASLFLSHCHWDHIQGFPFFTPGYAPQNVLDVYGVQSPDSNISVKEVFGRQMEPPFFPVGLKDMKAEMRFTDIPTGENIRLQNTTVRHLEVDHPNGCVAYRFEANNKSVVYATDLEPTDGPAIDALIDFADKADVFIFDSMYTPEEYVGSNGPSRVGWGHSTFEVGGKIAHQAGVKQYCLFHHDPSHDDTFMERLEERARGAFKNSLVAREGMKINI